MDSKIIHIEWEGPYNFDEIGDFGGDCDYGVYQIYGAHQVYGSDVLLYIGMAQRRPFAKRIKEHEDYFRTFCADFSELKFYIGRLAGNSTPNNDQWEKEIMLAEKLLIVVHAPSHNSKDIKWLSDKNDRSLKHIHILN